MNKILERSGVAEDAVTRIDVGQARIDRPPGSIAVSPGDDIQALVDAAKPGAVFWLEAGTHRLQSIQPKDGQQFLGEKGAILNGSRLLTDFSRDGDGWSIGGQTQQGERRALDEVVDGFDRGGFPDTVFMDNKPLKPVASIDDLAPGTFYFDYAKNRIHLADDPTGHKVEAGVATYAFFGNAKDVRVENLIVEKYANPVQQGAIGGGGAPEGWVIRDNEVRLNFGVGVTAGTDSRIVGNDVHNNGQMGIGGNGDDILVARNEIAKNGYFAGIDPSWEGGGSKFAQTDGLVVRNNYSHHNNGFGLWTDIDNINTLYEGNRIEFNLGGGINHEISYDATIRGNTFVGNGSGQGWLWGSAILLQNSSNVEIYDNAIDLTGSGNGIGLIQQDRGDGLFGPYVTTGNHVHGNAIFLARDSGSFGAVADHDLRGLLAGRNIFDENHYYVPDVVGDRWAWGGFYNWKDYRDVSGQDADSTLTLLLMGGGGADVIRGGGRNDVLVGRGGDDLIICGAGRDWIVGGRGDDDLVAGRGKDTFNFGAQFGDDRVENFVPADGPGEDRLRFSSNLFATDEDVLDAARKVGSDVVIEAGRNSVRLLDFKLSDLDANDILIF
ncbi:right-handed parallel beta-helix repeat-containing protein [Hansschlegelia zhihuaiae]|uniref:Right-handed parallel beta-helix repeat-containing protein n=1 Tax=Hansschlegelia zhihuaiae TaxID=405005 RepID=A0A4Q0MC88_9HYPH|nr:right-handed parallel beta-helix repeat-containing protein [Hansschlegelia zhihuaiae]RXF70941.1 right-handed parallel beta-helix repeat-containing protein [Hansschlegelia zhihuaiae]